MADTSEPIEDFLGDTAGFFEDVQYEDTTATEPETDDLNVLAGETEPPIQVGDGTCSVCGAPTFRPPGLTKSGRKKRVPKYCDLHTPNLQIPSIGPRAQRMESQLQRVQDELADEVRLLATLAGPLLPVTGYYAYEQADPFTNAIVRLASKNQTALRILHRAATIAPIYTVAETLAGIAYSVQVDMKGADPHNMVGKKLKVAQAYDAVYGDQNSQPSQNGFAPPPRYGEYASVQ